MAMNCANMLSTLSGEYDGLEMVRLWCTLVDGLVRLVLYLFWDVGLLR